MYRVIGFKGSEGESFFETEFSAEGIAIDACIDASHTFHDCDWYVVRGREGTEEVLFHISTMNRDDLTLPACDPADRYLSVNG